MMDMAKLGFLKSLVTGVFLGFFFYETAIGGSIVSWINTNLTSLGEYNVIIIPIVVVVLACILIDNKISGAFVGLVLGILLYNFSLYFNHSVLLISNLSQGNTQDAVNSIFIVLNQLKSNISSFPFIVTVVTSVSIGFSFGKHLGKSD